MTRQYAAPGAGVADETGSRQYAAPGGGVIAETVLAARSATLSATIGNLTLSAADGAVDSAVLVQTIAAPTLAATAVVVGTGSLAATIGPITLAATDQDIIAAIVSATIGAITLSATAAGAAARGRDGVYPWWWHQYVQRILGERALAEEKARRERELWAVDGDGDAVAPAPWGHAEAEHIRPSDDEFAALTAIWLLTTNAAGDLPADDVAEFWDPGEAAPVHPDDEAAIATAMSFLLRTKEPEYA